MQLYKASMYKCVQVLRQVDTILFSLLILRSLSDSQGRVWRCHPHQLYVVEITSLNKIQPDHKFPGSQTLALLNLLPSVTCLSPEDVLEKLHEKSESGMS